jgi:cyclic-di-AMP phosphodiesterase PgpH
MNDDRAIHRSSFIVHRLGGTHMRRRWSIRPVRRRREPRPPRTPAEQERRQRRQLALAVCALALALWAILSARPPTQPGLEEGSPSPSDIRARRSVPFTSELLTEAQRVRAESAVDTLVYTRDSDIPIVQRAQLADLLQTITQIRDDPSLVPAARRAKLASLPNSTLVISPELAAAIVRLSDDEWNNVRLQSLSLYARARSSHPRFWRSSRRLARSTPRPIGAMWPARGCLRR